MLGLKLKEMMRYLEFNTKNEYEEDKWIWNLFMSVLEFVAMTKAESVAAYKLLIYISWKYVGLSKCFWKFRLEYYEIRPVVVICIYFKQLRMNFKIMLFWTCLPIYALDVNISL